MNSKSNVPAIAAPSLTYGSASGGERPGHALFTKTCGSCHTIGHGPRVGPDLAGLLKRRDREWVRNYIASPEKVRASSDPIALDLAMRYRAVRMPNLGMSQNDISDLLAYLDVRSAALSNTQPSPQ